MATFYSNHLATAAAPSTRAPQQMNVYESGGRVRFKRFEIELPGIAPEQVEVTLDQGVLTVRGEKRASTATTTEAAAPKWHVAERVQGAFKRTFQLPQAVAEDRIAASFANGLLTVLVPKEAPRARKIDVTVA